MDLMDLILDPEIQAALRPLSALETQLLHEQLDRDGILEPLVVWPRDGRAYLVDGFHRYAWAAKAGRGYKTIVKDFASRDAAIEWARRKQAGRRNDDKVGEAIARAMEAAAVPKSPGGRPRKPAPPKSTGEAQTEPVAARSVPPVTADPVTGKNCNIDVTVSGSDPASRMQRTRERDLAEALQTIAAVNEQAASIIRRGGVERARADILKMSRLKAEDLVSLAERVASGEVKDLGRALASLKARPAKPRQEKHEPTTRKEDAAQRFGTINAALTRLARTVRDARLVSDSSSTPGPDAERIAEVVTAGEGAGGFDVRLWIPGAREAGRVLGLMADAAAELAKRPEVIARANAYAQAQGQRHVAASKRSKVQRKRRR